MRLREQVNKMSLTKLVVKVALQVPKLEEYQRFLFIGPHPDDIEIGAGATAAKLRELGKDVCFVICADGRFGDEFVDVSVSADELVTIRQQEAKASAARLGVDDVRFLGFSDGGFYDKDDLFKSVLSVISDFQPDIVFAPDPCVTSECHADHLNVGECVRRATYFAPYPGIMQAHGLKKANVKALAYYMTAKANFYVKISAEQFEKQLSSIFDCHLSQFPNDNKGTDAIKLYLKVRSVDYGLRCFSRHGEGFRLLGPTHMHCLPEAGE